MSSLFWDKLIWLAALAADMEICFEYWFSFCSFSTKNFNFSIYSFILENILKRVEIISVRMSQMISSLF